MDFIKDNWNWINENIWKITTLVSISFIAGWTLANLFYKERIEILKSKTKENKNPDIIKNDEFIYPENGKNGKNILSNSTLTILKNEKVSLKAIIPINEKLLVELKGPQPIHKDDNDPSWVYPLGRMRNWVQKTYEPEKGGRQEFDAEDGIADMELIFQRTGEFSISVCEGDKRSNIWSKTLKVRA